MFKSIREKLSTIISIQSNPTQYAMAPSLRQRLVCFYCGRRSAEKAHSTLRKWKCTNCEAVNHLDEVCILPRWLDLSWLRSIQAALTCTVEERRNHRSASIGVRLICTICSFHSSGCFSHAASNDRRDSLLPDLPSKPASPYPNACLLPSPFCRCE